MSDDESTEGGAGAASLAGYEYQIDVSVWLALDLIIVSHLTEELILEPASQEDLEAELTEAEPSRVVSQMPMNGYRLIVQAKRRSGDAWTPTTLKTLLDYGSDNRKSAAERLKDPNARYLLVTSAGLNGEARALRRRKAGTWPKADTLPKVIADEFDHDIAGRVAIIANQDDERLRGDIERLLTDGCRVPNSRLEDCRKKLREEARARIAGAGGGRWSRQDIETVIREHDGYLASAPELEHFVHPTNWSDLRAAMRDNSAAIIIGQSGTGKTLSTKMLYDELRREIPGLARVPIRLGPSQLRDDDTPSPVLFDIEDPWGRFDFDPASRPWNDLLADFFNAARPDRMIIATSRLDVAQSSGALSTVKPFVVNLEAENYGKSERQRLYRNRIASLSRDLQTLARGSERQVLDSLATPLEIQKFFDAMRTQDRAGLKNPPGYVADAIKSAHRNSIERTVIEQIEHRKDIRAAAVIWALLTASDKVTRAVLREIDDGMADRDPTMERGVSPLVDFFVAARNLRQSEGGLVTYYHPRVEKGIITTLEKHHIVARKTVRLLIDFLVSADGPGAEWGAGAAARMIEGDHDKIGIKPSPEAAAKIDAWLAGALAEGGKDFERNLDIAASAGSKSSNVAEVARFLLHRPDMSFGGFTSWGAPKHAPEWYAARLDDASTKPLIETFIRDVLPRERVDFGIAFPNELKKLATGLAPAFLDAARKAVHYGYITSDDAIAEGALEDLEGFEPIVDAAVSELTPSEADLKAAQQTHLDIVNSVYSDDYAQHLAENDDGHTAGEFLRAYVARVRQEKGWQSIAQHQHIDVLRPYWLGKLAAEAREEPVADDEIAGAFQSGFGTSDEENLWIAILNAWDPKYLPSLKIRVTDGSPDARIEHAALACLIEHDPQGLAEITAKLSVTGDLNRLIEIARSLAYLRAGGSRDPRKHVEAADAAAMALPSPFDEICEADVAYRRKEVPVLSDSARATLEAVPNPSAVTRSVKLELDLALNLATEEDVRWALSVNERAESAVLGVEAAVRHGMDAELETALQNKFADAAALALTAVANPLPAPLPPRLLGLANHRASPVLRALASTLKRKPHPEHREALMLLARNEWSKNSDHYGNESDDYPIAQQAVDALADLAPLGDIYDAELLSFGVKTGDPDLRGAICLLLAKQGGLPMQQRLFDLAVTPGRTSLRSSASRALIRAGSEIEQSIIELVTPRLIATRYEPVAADFALLIGWRGRIEAIREVAEVLASNPKRRALLLLVIWTLKDRDRPVAEELAAMLPPGHRGIAWALGEALESPQDSLIEDLGEPAVCAEVLKFMKY